VVGSLQSLGKAPLADLKSGLATAPVLYAAEEFPDLMEPLIARKFEGVNDVADALAIVQRSTGLQRTKQLAQVHAELAVDIVQRDFVESVARDALISLACRIVTRTS